MARPVLGLIGRLGLPVLCAAAATGALSAAPAADHRRTWELNQVTWVKLVPKEKEAALNAHPFRVEPAALQRQLEGILVVADSGEESLFVKEELALLAGPICEALGVAGPEEDLVLLSSFRRGVGFMSPQLGVTARLFAQGGKLNVIVKETRLDFVSRYVMNNDKPNFQYGSRKVQGLTRLRGAGVQPQRGDWIVLPVQAAEATPQPAAPAPQAAPAPSPASVPVQEKAKDPGTPAEQRLRTLKRLRDENLISEEEYQQKRRDILKEL